MLPREVDGDRFSPRRNLHLVQQTVDVVLHRLQGQREPRCDLLIGQALCDQLENLDFPS